MLHPTPAMPFTTKYVARIAHQWHTDDTDWTDLHRFYLRRSAQSALSACYSNPALTPAYACTISMALHSGGRSTVTAPSCTNLHFVAEPGISHAGRAGESQRLCLARIVERYDHGFAGVPAAMA